jgi:hypothetical protein
VTDPRYPELWDHVYLTTEEKDDVEVKRLLDSVTCPHGRTEGHAVNVSGRGAHRGDWCGPSPKLPDDGPW